MAKYYLKKWKSFPIRNKSDWQLDRFATVGIASVNNPDVILEVVPIFGDERFINLIHNIERNVPLDEKSKFFMEFMSNPIEGDFEEEKSFYGPLYRKYTPIEATYGLCPQSYVGKPVLDITGKVKVYHSVRVFTWYTNNPYWGKSYIKGWFPSDMLSKYYGYRYFPISKLRDLTDENY